MPRLVGWIGVTAAAILTLSAAGVRAQLDSIPAGPIKIVTQQGPGGATITAMRLVTDRLEKRWGRPVTLVPQPGGGGLLAAKTAAEAAPDGRTLFMALASTFLVLPETHKSLPFDIARLTPVGFVGEVPMAVGVSAELPVTSLQELIALSKQRPGGTQCGGRVPRQPSGPHDRAFSRALRRCYHTHPLSGQRPSNDGYHERTCPCFDRGARRPARLPSDQASGNCLA